MKRTFFAFILLSVFVFQSFAQTPNVKITSDELKAASSVTAKQLSDYLHFVASDEMEGRDTPSRGLDLTAKFIGMNLSSWGFKPAGDNGTFYQKLGLTREESDLEISEKIYSFGEDFLKIAGNGSAVGPLVFGGDGWMVKAKGIDAFAGVDVKGKIVVITAPALDPRTITPLPSGVNQSDLKGVKGTDWADAVTHAKEKGAVGVLVVTPASMQPAWPMLRRQLGRVATYLERLPPASAIPVMLVTHSVGEAIFAGESANGSTKTAFSMTKNSAFSTRPILLPMATQNVVAIWEGSDPVLKNEMVAIGAHYDHDGIKPDAPGTDKIYNGADDDGSGTVAVLAIAEALSKSKNRPKRSILFVWHAGEEKGLLGSEYFTKFPTVDIKNVVAQINIDMIGRSRAEGDTNPKNKELSGANTIYVIGSEMMSSTLGAVTKQTNDAFLKLTYDYKYDDPKDPNRFFFRSDHYHYATNGIPVAFWFDGVHEDYHQPSDTADKIDYQKMEKVTRTIFLTLWELAALKTRPVVDKELPAELKQR